MSRKKKGINRREFIKTTALGSAAILWGCSKSSSPTEQPIIPGPNNPQSAKIILYKTQDRRDGVKKLFELAEYESPSGKNILLKPNLNTADPPPASTHNDTLSQIVYELQDRNAGNITLVERSYQNFNEVINQKGIDTLAASHNFNIVNLDNETMSVFQQGGLNWRSGFFFPNIVRDSEYIVCTCCLKTHSLATYTMSIKLAVGMLPTSEMRILHGSSLLRTLIAEINTAFTPKLYIMDGVLTFITGGPSSGTVREGDVMLAGTDRVTLDAVGVAILKDLGCTRVDGPIFQQEQISRAVELGLGIDSPDKIEFVTPNDESSEYAERLQTILADG